MKLRDYVMYDNVDVSSLFNSLSKQLKVIHNNKYVVNNLNCEDIFVGDEIAFKKINSSDNFEQDQRNNIISLAKIMIGVILSRGTNFRDFSQVDTNWFVQNFDNIFSVINEENFDKEYFYSILIDGNNKYYSDYLNEKKNKQELSGKENVNSYKKVLTNAASSLYQGIYDDDTSDFQEKKAAISASFNPLLLVGAMVIFLVLVLLFVLIS